MDVTEQPGPAWGAPVGGSTQPETTAPESTESTGPVERSDPPRRRRPPPRPVPLPPLTRKERRRVRLVERFGGKRIHNRVGAFRRIRSLILIVILALLLAAVLAGIFAAIVAGLALAFHHASGT